MKRLAAPLIAVMLLSACASDDPPTDPGGRPPEITVIARTLTLFPGRERAVRFGVEAFEGLVNVLSAFDPPSAAVELCPMASVTDPIPPPADCRPEIRSGVRTPIGSSGTRAFAIVLTGAAEVTLDVTLQYEEAGRALVVVMPLMRAWPGGAACADNACNPIFEMLPVRSGSFTASAAWDGPDARFVLLQGGVRGRAQTATGVPYREPASDIGASPLQLDTKIGAPAEYALAFVNGQGAPSANVVISAAWP